MKVRSQGWQVMLMVVGGWSLHSKTLCKEEEGSPLSIYNSWCLWWLGPFFHASRLCRGGGRGQWMEASGSLAAVYVVKYRRAMPKINLSAFPLLHERSDLSSRI